MMAQFLKFLIISTSTYDPYFVFVLKPPPCLIQWRKNKRRAHSMLSAASHRAQESRFDVATSLNCAPKRVIMSYGLRFILRCQANSNSFWIPLGDTYIMSTKFSICRPTYFFLGTLLATNLCRCPMCMPQRSLYSGCYELTF